MTSAPKRFPLGLDDLVRAPASKTGKPGAKGAQSGVNAKTNIGVKTATKATVAHAGFDSMKAPPVNPSATAAKPRTAPASGAAAGRVASAPFGPAPRPSAGAASPAPRSNAPTAPRSNASAPRSNPSAPTGARGPGPASSAAQPASFVSRTISRPVPQAAVPTPPRVMSPVAAAVKTVPAQNAQRGATAAASPAHFSLTSERVRERMVERVRANGVSDPRVLAAMGAVPRHLFVDPGFATQAYEEAALPIGHHQTISKPSVVARMIELAANGRILDNVLEIGTGCGYQAAVLSGMARDVYSIERIRPLYERAKQNLRPLRIPNIRLHYGDGRLGMPKVAPFDAIVIAAAGLDVPQALLEQLQIGGRLVAPVGAESQVLTLVERVAENQWHESQLDRVFFVPLKSGVI